MCSNTTPIHQLAAASYLVARWVHSVCQSCWFFFFQFQSCPVGRGPEFSRSVFDVYGHSPLVEQFLRMRKLSKDCGTSVLIQRTEIKSLPPYPFSCRKLQSWPSLPSTVTFLMRWFQCNPPLGLLGLLSVERRLVPLPMWCAFVKHW